jgi:hypothetical protein
VDEDGKTVDLKESYVDETVLKLILEKDMLARSKMIKYYSHIGKQVDGEEEEDGGGEEGMLKVGVGMMINQKMFIIK